MIWPLWQPLVLATWFAIFARPLMKRLSGILRGRHRAAAVLTVLLLLLVLVPLGLIVASLISASSELLETLLKSKGGKHALAAIVSGDAADGHRFTVRDIMPLTKQYGERAFGYGIGHAARFFGVADNYHFFNFRFQFIGQAVVRI